MERSEEANSLHPILVITGPTAVGKSSLALDVAEAVGGVIISADSRQVYRGLDVGTAKPSEADRQRVVHHLLDVLELGASYSAGQYRDGVVRTITEIQSQNHPAVVVGGSTLYVDALVGSMADLPPLPDPLRADLIEVASDPDGQRRLYAELAAADPEAAATLDATKSHRLARLVGLLRHTRRRPSDLWRDARVEPIPHVLVVLDRPRADLYARIDLRVDQMVTDGLVAEVETLYEMGDHARQTLMATIGYRETVQYLDGEHDLERAVELIKRNSRRYAKRQLTWFRRRYPDAVWLDARTATASSVLEAVAPWPRRR